MAIYKKVETTHGAWAKSGEIKEGSTAEIKSETSAQPSQFKNKDGSIKMQDVCKVSFNGEEPLNVSLNRATINALVEAFGEDSKEWIGNELKVETEKMRVGGRAVVALYLIPEGYERIDDENGYAVIIKSDGVKTKGNSKKSIMSDDIPVIEEDDIDASKIPF